MIVYRVQREDNTGPYPLRGGPIDLYIDWNRHPLPSSDGIKSYHITLDHYFGFESIEHLEQWFDSTLRDMLHQSKYKVYEYEVPDDKVMKGNRQLCFIYHLATVNKVYSLDLNDRNNYRQTETVGL